MLVLIYRCWFYSNLSDLVDPESWFLTPGIVSHLICDPNPAKESLFFAMLCIAISCIILTLFVPFLPGFYTLLSAFELLEEKALYKSILLLLIIKMKLFEREFQSICHISTQSLHMNGFAFGCCCSFIGFPYS